MQIQVSWLTKFTQIYITLNKGFADGIICSCVSCCLIKLNPYQISDIQWHEKVRWNKFTVYLLTTWGTKSYNGCNRMGKIKYFPKQNQIWILLCVSVIILVRLNVLVVHGSSTCSVNMIWWCRNELCVIEHYSKPWSILFIKRSNEREKYWLIVVCSLNKPVNLEKTNRICIKNA